MIIARSQRVGSSSDWWSINQSIHYYLKGSSKRCTDKWTRNGLGRSGQVRSWGQRSGRSGWVSFCVVSRLRFNIFCWRCARNKLILTYLSDLYVFSHIVSDQHSERNEYNIIIIIIRYMMLIWFSPWSCIPTLSDMDRMMENNYRPITYRSHLEYQTWINSEE